jgi:hypothetical protein
MEGAVSPRALIKKHKNPVAAFEAADPGQKGALDIRTTRQVLQNLGVPLGAIEMASYARTFGDGKTIDYRKFLAAHEVPLSPVAKHLKELASPVRGASASASSSSGASASASSGAGGGPASSPFRRDKPIPGNPARPDGWRPEQDPKSRMLKFESDSHDFPHYIHGNPAHELASPLASMRAGKRTDYPQRELDYTKHKLAVVGSDLAEVEAYHAHEDAEVRNYARADGEAGATDHFEDPLFAGGLISKAGSVGQFLSDVKANEPLSDDYLPLFPGEYFPRKRNFDPLQHGGKVSKAGGVIKFMNDESWKDEHPEGYLPPLPNGLMDSPRAIVYDPINQQGALIGAGSAGTAAWAADAEGLDAQYDRIRRFHRDPLYHSSELGKYGGIAGIGEAGRTWLEDVPTAPGMQYQTTPPGAKSIRSRSAAKQRSSGKNRGAPRRRSVPDLLSGRYTTQSLADRLAGHADEEGDGGGDDGEDGGGDEQALVSGIARSNRRLYQESLEVAGPLTDFTGDHHNRMSHMLGARSPVAVAMAAAPLAKFDTRKLALVRKHIRGHLPSKSAAAVATLKHRLGPRDGDKDGRLTDSELMSALTEMMPDLHAEEIGLVIRYMRQRNAKRAAAAKEDAAVKAGTPPRAGAGAGAGSLEDRIAAPIVGPEEISQLTVSTAGFGEGIDVAELAEWVAKQPGGHDVVTSPLYAKGPHTITSFSNSPPSPGSDPDAHHSRKKSPLRSPRLNEDDPHETREHARPATDSSGAATAIFDAGASFFDPRKEHAADEDYSAEVGSLLSAHTFLSSKTRANKKGMSYEEFHRLRRLASGDFARGDPHAPAAGMLSGDRKSVLGGGKDKNAAPATDRTEWAEKNAKFEKFRADWEVRHGEGARKEMKMDAALGSEGPTWTRAEPAPFKVLHLASAPPASPMQRK